MTELSTDPVEISPCPSCQTKLTVEVQYLGQDVQCPSCNTVFQAQRAGQASAEAPPLPPPAPPKKSRLEDAGRNKPTAEDEEDDDRPRKKRRYDDDDEETDDADNPPRKRRWDDDEEDDRPRKKKKKRFRGGEPHRGVTILILGILGLACCAIFGIMAYYMGKADLEKMDAGRMDEEGRSLTQVGKILGLVSLILFCVSLILGCLAGGLQAVLKG